MRTHCWAAVAQECTELDDMATASSLHLIAARYTDDHNSKCDCRRKIFFAAGRGAVRIIPLTTIVGDLAGVAAHAQGRSRDTQECCRCDTRKEGAQS